MSRKSYLKNKVKRKKAKNGSKKIDVYRPKLTRKEEESVLGVCDPKAIHYLMKILH